MDAVFGRKVTAALTAWGGATSDEEEALHGGRSPWPGEPWTWLWDGI